MNQPEFKKANEVKFNSIDDPGARQFLRDIIVDINSRSPSLIKNEIAKMCVNVDSGITKKEANRAIKQLERMSSEELKQL